MRGQFGKFILIGLLVSFLTNIQAHNTCKRSKFLSPINIPAHVSNAGEGTLKINYNPMPLVIINKKNKIQLRFDNQHNAMISIAGEDYHLVQFLIHTPSSNTLNGQPFPLEIDFVNQNAKREYVIIGLFVKVGKPNAVLQKALDHLPNRENIPIKVQGESIDPGEFFPSDLSYYRFEGSLPASACRQSAQWVVLKTPITASAVQIAQFSKATDGANTKPVQPLKGRTISYYQED